jgi:hypothetical protein
VSHRLLIDLPPTIHTFKPGGTVTVRVGSKVCSVAPQRTATVRFGSNVPSRYPYLHTFKPGGTVTIRVGSKVCVQLCSVTENCYRQGWIQCMCSVAPQGAVTVRVLSNIRSQGWIQGKCSVAPKVICHYQGWIQGRHRELSLSELELDPRYSSATGICPREGWIQNMCSISLQGFLPVRVETKVCVALRPHGAVTPQLWIQCSFQLPLSSHLQARGHRHCQG